MKKIDCDKNKKYYKTLYLMAGELSWLERGTHKPEVSGSIPLPATKV